MTITIRSHIYNDINNGLSEKVHLEIKLNNELLLNRTGDNKKNKINKEKFNGNKVFKTFAPEY